MITKEQAEKAKEIVSGFDGEQKKQFLDKYAALDEKGKETVITRLLGTTTQKPTQPTQSGLAGTLQQRMSEVDRDVAGRGDYIQGMTANFQSPNPIRKALGGVQAVALPSTAIESAIANPSLAMQRGQFDPARLLQESYQGITLQKTGQYGDVYRGAIPDKTTGKVVGALGGLTLSLVAPMEAFRAAKRTFGDVSKISDKSLKSAGNQMVKSSDEAEAYIGKKIGEAYKPVDSELVDGNSWTRALGALPEPVRKEITRKMGDIDTLPNTVGNLRAIKSELGSYRPSSYSAGTKGLQETIESNKVNEAYSGIKSVLTNTIAKKIGTKKASQLLELDDAAANVYNATKEIKSTVVNPRLLLPTRAGSAAKKMEDSADVSTREAINIIRRGGGKQAKKLMDKAVRTMEIFNARERNWRRLGHAVQAATYGGAIGAVGGAIAGRLLNRGGGSSE